MAPDINSLPTSPRPDQHRTSQPPSTSASRRTSAVMPPPSQPTSAVTGGPRSPIMSSNENNVPMRHPRPLTAAELYAECEKEQEAVVNRLTRELTALRAQSASVASNASVSSNSTSASLLPVDISDPNPTHQMTGATHPTPSRRHRSSSSVSTRSIPTPATSVSQAGSGATNHSTQVQAGSTTNTATLNGVSQAQADRAAAAGGGPRDNLSRQPSASASGTSTPARQSMEIPRMSGGSYTLPYRTSISRETPTSSTHAQAGTPPVANIQQLPSPAQSPSVISAMQHYADTAAYRTEMEIVKAENDALRQRVRMLERALRARRRDSSQSDAHRPADLRPTPETSESGAMRATSVVVSPPPSAGLGVAAWAANDGGVRGVAGPRERSESQSTTASSRRGMGGGAAAEDEVRVGESASSVGVFRGV
ncbi:Hypothetical predicted protein [Lecanosticta acicola]|uniref:Uncharacterized protein n=1 Tax=Lecanosticta acicola TaxID=111012 RepID=A0AAI8YSA6_9PEZI|nr:Hypothetical predicted protein [Lecanosticta acicola]